MATGTHNVFISHIHEDDDGLTKLKELLDSHGFSIRDASIDAEKPNNAQSPDYIKSVILAPRIQWAGTMLVYISPETQNSEYVDWEVEYAHKLGKRIVGVWAQGDKDCPTPQAVDDYADAVVAWNGDAIIRAINGESGSWQTPVGTPKPSRVIARYSCG